MLLPPTRILSKFSFLETGCPQIGLSFLVADVLPFSARGSALRFVLRQAVLQESRRKSDAQEAAFALRAYARQQETQKKLEEARNTTEKDKIKELTLRPVISDYAKNCRAPRKTIQFFADGLEWTTKREKKLAEKREKRDNELADDFKTYCARNPLITEASKNILEKSRNRDAKQGKPSTPRRFSSPRQQSPRDFLHEGATGIISRFSFSPMISLYSELLTADLPPVTDRMADDIKQRRVQTHEQLLANSSREMLETRLCKRVFRDPKSIESITRRLLSPDPVEAPPNPDLTFSPRIDEESLRIIASSQKHRDPLHTPRRTQQRHPEGGAQAAEPEVKHASDGSRTLLSRKQLSQFLSRMDRWSETKQAARRDRILAEDEQNTFSPRITPYELSTGLFASPKSAKEFSLKACSDTSFKQTEAAPKSATVEHSQTPAKKMQPFFPTALSPVERVRPALDSQITAELHSWFRQIARGGMTAPLQESLLALGDLLRQLGFSGSPLKVVAERYRARGTLMFVDFVELFEAAVGDTVSLASSW